jgi:hypothetical protein
MHDYLFTVEYDTNGGEEVSWQEVVRGRDDATAIEAGIRRFISRHVPGLNITAVYVRRVEG